MSPSPVIADPSPARSPAAVARSETGFAPAETGAASLSRAVHWWQFRRVRLAVLGLVLLAVTPAAYVFFRTADARRDIVYWDEFDTALSLVLKLHEGPSAREFLHELVGINNEHRMVTSRLLYAVSYWLTGTINFVWIDVIGNAAIVAACLLLVAAAGGGSRRLRLGLLLGFLVFQLEHYENFLWSGSSIDHFQVVLLAAAASIALARNSRGGLAAAILFAVLATYTLAHGLAVWPAGALVLWAHGRRRHLAVWIGMGALALAGFLAGFQLNSAQQFAPFSLAGLAKVAQYWLAVLGAVPAVGHPAVAPFFGLALLALLVPCLRRQTLRGESVMLAMVLFAITAAGLIAVGRAEHSGGQVFSRYYVLSAVAWALVLFLLSDRLSALSRPLLAPGLLVPPLLFFNVSANREFADETDSWLNCRDLAAVNYKQHDVDGHGPFNLHPNPERATTLLHQAEDLGVYRLGPVCLPVRFPRQAHANSQIQYFIEEIVVNSEVAAVRGWAGLPGQVTRRGSTRLVLRSADAQLLYTTVTVPRADVPAVMKQPGWTNAGFHFARLREHLPDGDYQIGLLITNGRRSEYIMTGHRLQLGATPPAPRLATTN